MITTSGFRFALVILIFAGTTWAQLQSAPLNPPPDDRYKADILLIVAHPDDDTEVGPYLAKAIYDEHRRVAVIYGTRGDSGPNEVGEEQGQALANVREIEGRRAMASLGVMNVWFMPGLDTPGQDVLRSLETWRHGTVLDQMVRLVRLTRPEVILTWLPDYVVGENHDDHQASGVIATEAFDMAGDPLAFPEQLEAPRNHSSISNYGEGLKPWQPKKIYYFSDATHFDFFQNQGPQYSSDQISPSKGVPYAKLAQECWNYYKSQNDLVPQETNEQLEPTRFIFGKSLVKSMPTGDIFEGVTPGAIPYTRPRGYEQPPRLGLSLELGGPWAFYSAFWPAHGIGHLGSLLNPEAGIGPGETLWVPLLIHNDTDSPQQIILRSILPTGWTEKPGAMVYTVAPWDSYPLQLSLVPPESAKGTWQNLTWIAEANGKKVGSVTLHANVVSNGLPQ